MFLKIGSEWHRQSTDDIQVYNILPPKNFVVKYNKLTSKYYLVVTDDFRLPDKIYGNTESMAKRIIETFSDRESTTGTLLSGDKGSGKSLLAKKLSVDLKGAGIPTIIINESFSGEEFSQFLAGITQPVMVFLDEFEKTYNWSQQQNLLTILDGTHSSKKLFVVTVNNINQVSEFMINRPGRFYYALNYSGLEENFIREYCIDNLKDLKQIDSIIKVSKTFSSFSFDILKTVIEEMNRYGETIHQVMDVLNTKPDFGKGEKYNVKFYYQGAALDKEYFYPNTFNNVNIISDDNTVWLIKKDGKFFLEEDELKEIGEVVEDEDDGDYHVTFTPADINSFELTGDIVYKAGDFKIVLEKISKFKLDIKKLA